MKLTFHSIRIRNFLSIGNEPEVFPLDKNDFTVIIGQNGSGKSTVIDAISYALYKRAYRPKLKLGQLINNTNKKKMLVEIAFSVGGSSYVVRRGEKPKVFEIYKDKDLIEADPTIGDMQSYLEERILQQNFKTFSQINVISKVAYTQFMDLTPADRRTVVENILDTNIYSVMQVLGKNDLKNLQSDINTTENEINLLENKIETTNKLLLQYQSNKRVEIDECEEKISDLQSDINDLEFVLSQLKGKHEKEKQKVEEIIPNNTLDKVKQKISEVTSDIGEHRAVINRTTSIISKIDTMDDCPHCLQQVDQAHKDQILQQNNQERDQAQAKYNKLTTLLNGIKDRLENRESQQRIADEVDRKIQNTENQINLKRNSITQYHQRITKLNQPEQTNLPDVTELENDLMKLNQSRDQLIIKANDLKQAISYLGDDGIKSILINKYIPVINQKINEYLERMGLFVEFNLDSEFNETISAINRDLFTYHSFSEGQKQRIDLAILLTWRYIAQIRNSMSTNLFFMDEVADGSMDSEGIEEFINILRDMTGAQNTFLISHRMETQELFENCIKVEMDGNFSKYTHE